MSGIEAAAFAAALARAPNDAAAAAAKTAAMSAAAAAFDVATRGARSAAISATLAYAFALNDAIVAVIIASRATVWRVSSTSRAVSSPSRTARAPPPGGAIFVLVAAATAAAACDVIRSTLCIISSYSLAVMIPFSNFVRKMRLRKSSPLVLSTTDDERDEAEEAEAEG